MTKPDRAAYNNRMTTDAKIYIEALSHDPLPAKYLRNADRHAVRFAAAEAVFRIETDGKSARIVKSAEVGYELVLGESSALTLKTAEGEFVEPNVRLRSLEFAETPNGFTLSADYSLPPHDENKTLRVICEK